MYDENVVRPMREELTSIGVTEMKSSEEVDQILSGKQGTVLIVVNSVCGCSAGGARPAVKMALTHSKKPDKLTTVFAGQDKEATTRAREYFAEYPPSSPSIALLKDGRPVMMLQRHDIEGYSAQEIASKLVAGFEEYC